MVYTTTFLEKYTRGLYSFLKRQNEHCTERRRVYKHRLYSLILRRREPPRQVCELAGERIKVLCVPLISTFVVLFTKCKYTGLPYVVD